MGREGDSTKILTGTKAEVMKILWKSDKPLSTEQIVLASDKYSEPGIRHGVTDLRKLGYIRSIDEGIVQNRRFVPTFTTEEYLRNILADFGLSPDELIKIGLELKEKEHGKET